VGGVKIISLMRCAFGANYWKIIYKDIYESNKTKQIIFAKTLEEALKIFKE
jgi:hypothetical protein